ncbi:hypothetical protein O3M35_003134 [Rhynocoris fuscipes]|uniref:Uncharacterized protein n=1 Tax=Rhynocoris fuscipes TaxID=488301 RepID=A0AAW1CJD1_9HEMI
MRPTQTAVVLAATLGVVCLAWPHTVMALDLSRLYGHPSAKRNNIIREFIPKTRQRRDSLDIFPANGK